MKNPNKLYSIGESFVGKMMILMELIPEDGISIDDFYDLASRRMGVLDFIDAITCMFYIQSIGLTDNKVVYKIC